MGVLYINIINLLVSYWYMIVQRFSIIYYMLQIFHKGKLLQFNENIAYEILYKMNIWQQFNLAS